jgi:hypothetical protein
VVAIVNSGAFRCDSELKPELKGRDLRETFLFDDEKSIMVLKVAAEVVKKLIEHGEAKPGTGAFPQIASECATGKVWLAISSFLLIRSDNNDGYDAVLHDLWGSQPFEGTVLADRKATREAAETAAVAWFRITDAVTNKAAIVPVKILPENEVKAAGGADRILQLLRSYVEIFYENISPDHRNFPSKETWLGSDDHIDQPAIRKARDAVRTFLKELRSVQIYEDVAASPNKGAQWKDKARKAWMDAKIDLQDLRDSLQDKDDLTSREGDSYVGLFEAAAVDIPGWGLLPALT